VTFDWPCVHRQGQGWGGDRLAIDGEKERRSLWQVLGV